MYASDNNKGCVERIVEANTNNPAKMRWRSVLFGYNATDTNTDTESSLVRKLVMKPTTRQGSVVIEQPFKCMVHKNRDDCKCEQILVSSTTHAQQTRILRARFINRSRLAVSESCNIPTVSHLNPSTLNQISLVQHRFGTRDLHGQKSTLNKRTDTCNAIFTPGEPRRYSGTFDRSTNAGAFVPDARRYSVSLVRTPAMGTTPPSRVAFGKHSPEYTVVAQDTRRASILKRS